MSKDLTELTDKQLESEWTKAAKQFEEVKNLCREYAAENQRRAADREAERLMNSMGDAEKSALVQRIQAEGIESQESVNGGSR